MNLVLNFVLQTNENMLLSLVSLNSLSHSLSFVIMPCKINIGTCRDVDNFFCKKECPRRASSRKATRDSFSGTLMDAKDEINEKFRFNESCQRWNFFLNQDPCKKTAPFLCRKVRYEQKRDSAAYFLIVSKKEKKNGRKTAV